MLTLLLALPLTGAWISGPDYLAYSDLKANEPVTIVQKTTSEGFSADGCLLWARDGETGKISAYAPKRRIEIAEPTGEILSDVEGGEFFTRSASGTAIEQRDERGKILATYPAEWAAAAVRIVAGPEGQRWALLNTATTLTLAPLDAKLQPLPGTVLSQDHEIYGTPKILVDDEARAIWVGYSASRKGLSYSPHVARLDFAGKMEKVFQWTDRGLFFDACRDADRTLLVSRDKPSSPYTLPVYSSLERLSPTGEVAPLYAAETNYFIDALACQPDRLWMVERSIHGSDGAYLVSWDRVKGAPAKRLLRLPGPARKLYACSGFSEGISVE